MDWIIYVGIGLGLLALVGGLFWGGKFLALPMWTRLTIAGVVALGMFLGIWQLNAKYSASEPVWTEGDTAVQWDSVPVPVYADPDVRGDALDEALALWNQDCMLLISVARIEDSRIFITRGVSKTDPQTEKPLAGGTWKRSNGDLMVELIEAGGPAHEYLVLAHELGRALGLATDSDPRSIMQNRVQRLKDQFPLPGVTSKDRKALSARYCN